VVGGDLRPCGDADEAHETFIPRFDRRLDAPPGLSAVSHSIGSRGGELQRSTCLHQADQVTGAAPHALRSWFVRRSGRGEAAGLALQPRRMRARRPVAAAVSM